MLLRSYSIEAVPSFSDLETEVRKLWSLSRVKCTWIHLKFLLRISGSLWTIWNKSMLHKVKEKSCYKEIWASFSLKISCLFGRDICSTVLNTLAHKYAIIQNLNRGWFLMSEKNLHFFCRLYFFIQLTALQKLFCFCLEKL